jgi:hypothetical protein
LHLEAASVKQQLLADLVVERLQMMTWEAARACPRADCPSGHPRHHLCRPSTDGGVVWGRSPLPLGLLSLPSPRRGHLSLDLAYPERVALGRPLVVHLPGVGQLERPPWDCFSVRTLPVCQLLWARFAAWAALVEWVSGRGRR